MQTNVTVEGRAGYLFVPISVIAICAISAPLYYKDALPEFCVENAAKVLTIVSILELGLLFFAVFVGSRKMVLCGDIISYSSWFSDLKLRVADITDLSLQADHSPESSTTYYICVWGSSEVVLHVNPSFWDKSALAQMLRGIIEAKPGIQVAPEVRHYIAS